jgi:hypothetical protein
MLLVLGYADEHLAFVLFFRRSTLSLPCILREYARDRRLAGEIRIFQARQDGSSSRTDFFPPNEGRFREKISATTASSLRRSVKSENSPAGVCQPYAVWVDARIWIWIIKNTLKLSSLSLICAIFIRCTKECPFIGH